MTPQPRPRLTLGQLLKVPIFAAVAMAFIGPAVRSNAAKQHGLLAVVAVEAIVIPIAMAVVAQIILRRGANRERLVAALLCVSIVVSVAVVLLMIGLNLLEIGSTMGAGKGVPVDLLAFVLLLFGALIGLSAALETQLAKIHLDRCPACGRRMLVVDQNARTTIGRASGAPLVCDGCGAPFRRNPDGAIEGRDVDTSESGSRLPATIASSVGR